MILAHFSNTVIGMPEKSASSILFDDLSRLHELSESIRVEALKFLDGLKDRPPGVPAAKPQHFLDLPAKGIGTAPAVREFLSRYGSQISGSSGPRNFSFVTGGATPAALLGDWLVSAFDLNASHFGNSCAPWVELETLGMLRDLLGLPDSFQGVLVTGATMSNFVGIAQAREWAARQRGANPSNDGLYALQRIPVLGGTVHSSAIKCLSMLGMGRNSLQEIPLVPERECLDKDLLERALQALNGAPSIVLASAGTVNTGDFDDLCAIASLKSKYPFWLHIDAAFGGFVACSSKLGHLMQGAGSADSIAVDLHKWLNVPYDSAVAFSSHPDLQREVFRNHAPYLNVAAETPYPFADLAPENSRRFRALPTWFTLMAYGRDGYREIVDRNIRLAQRFAQRLASHPAFEVLSPVHSNIVCFALRSKDTNEILSRITQDGRAFFTKAVYRNLPAIRAAFVNWRTQEADIEIAFQAVTRSLGVESGASG